MTLKGYYLETLYPRFAIYRILVINFIGEFSTYTVAVNVGDKIEDEYPGYTDLGGIL